MIKRRGHVKLSARRHNAMQPQAFSPPHARTYAGRSGVERMHALGGVHSSVSLSRSSVHHPYEETETVSCVESTSIRSNYSKRRTREQRGGDLSMYSYVRTYMCVCGGGWMHYSSRSSSIKSFGSVGSKSSPYWMAWSQ